MTEIQFIRAMQEALSPNKAGDKPSLINALELVENFKKSVIKEYLKVKKRKDDYKYNDTKVKR